MPHEAAVMGQDGPTMRRLPVPMPWIPLLAVPAIAFAVLQVAPTLDVRARLHSPEGHFYIVSAVALVSVLLALVASVAALRSRNPRVVWLALAFLGMSGVFAVHGLSTPGFIVDDRFTAASGFSSRLSLVLAASFLAASSVDWPGPLSNTLVRGRATVLGGAVAMLAAYGLLVLVAPESVPPRVVTHWAFKDGTLLLVVVLGSVAAVRYLTGYLRSGLPMYGAVTLGCVFLVQAQLAQHFGAMWQGTFWLYHVQLIMGAIALLWGMMREHARGASFSGSIERLGTTDAVAQIREGYNDSIRTLAAALEARDGYTLGHGERVAALSVMIGEQMRLSPVRLRALAQGALLHDVGKIGIPDSVLHKPGALDEHEFAVIKEHPARGASMLDPSRGSDIERAVIRHHHERFDGTGYPDGLAGEAIALEARIAAVADVYDAVRSARSYRDAWTADEAKDLISRGAGTHFDPRCAVAFACVVDRWEAEYAADGVVYQERRAVA
ncbi:MAG: HD domain-containing protein [Dehalococcoidia bacterium]|nr:HD domain-containing protein [Dehalococcoidia bacterium]